MDYETRISDVDESKEHDLILTELRKYNRTHVLRDNRALTITLFDGDARLAAGLSGATYFGWLFIELLWVREDCRKDGLGKRLILLAETEAKARGCKHVYLDTFSYQAPGFYEKQGYLQYAKFDDFPGEHSRYFFKKDLLENG